VLDYTLIHQSTRPYAWRDWLALAEVPGAHDATAGPRYELFSMVAQAVKAGLGLAVLPRFLVQDEIADGTLAVPFALSLHSDFAYYLVWPAHKSGWRPLQLFQAWLCKQAAAQVRPR
jgi:LysR family glycine cleavage system transcriptional activator